MRHYTLVQSLEGRLIPCVKENRSLKCLRMLLSYRRFCFLFQATTMISVFKWHEIHCDVHKRKL